MRAVSSNDVGILTVRETSTDTEWTLSNQDATGIRRLREGHAAKPVFREIVAEVEQQWPGSGSQPGTYYVAVQIFAGRTLLSEHSRGAAEGGDLRPLLPLGTGFREIWDQASGIPKMYWYRHLGPFQWEGSQSLPATQQRKE